MLITTVTQQRLEGLSYAILTRKALPYIGAGAGQRLVGSVTLALTQKEIRDYFTIGMVFVVMAGVLDLIKLIIECM